jgi:disulfide bond formation protein DsbB
VGAIVYQMVCHVHPCPLCYVQRLSIVGIAICSLLNLKFGVKPLHYGFSLLFSFFGVLLSLRLAPIGVPVLGLPLSTWSLLIFSGSVLAAVFLLIFFQKTKPTWSILEKGTAALLAAIILATAIITL